MSAIASWDNTPPGTIGIGGLAAADNTPPGTSTLPGAIWSQGLRITHGLDVPKPPNAVAQQGPGSLAPGAYFYILEAIGLASVRTASTPVGPVTVSAPNNSVQLTWAKVEGANSYTIFRSTSPSSWVSPSMVATVLASQLIYTDLGAALQLGTPTANTAEVPPFYRATDIAGQHRLWAGSPGQGIAVPPTAAVIPPGASGAPPTDNPPGTSSVPGVVFDNTPPGNATLPPSISVGEPDNTPPGKATVPGVTFVDVAPGVILLT